MAPADPMILVNTSAAHPTSLMEKSKDLAATEDNASLSLKLLAGIHSDGCMKDSTVEAGIEHSVYESPRGPQSAECIRGRGEDIQPPQASKDSRRPRMNKRDCSYVDSVSMVGTFNYN